MTNQVAQTQAVIGANLVQIIIIVQAALVLFVILPIIGVVTLNLPALLRVESGALHQAALVMVIALVLVRFVQRKHLGIVTPSQSVQLHSHNGVRLVMVVPVIVLVLVLFALQPNLGVVLTNPVVRMPTHSGVLQAMAGVGVLRHVQSAR